MPGVQASSRVSDSMIEEDDYHGSGCNCCSSCELCGKVCPDGLADECVRYCQSCGIDQCPRCFGSVCDDLYQDWCVSCAE